MCTDDIFASVVLQDLDGSGSSELNLTSRMAGQVKIVSSPRVAGARLLYCYQWQIFCVNSLANECLSCCMRQFLMLRTKGQAI